MNRRLAAIDVGTNSVLLTVAEVDPTGELRPLLERAEITRLGRGVDLSGVLSPEGMEATLRVLATYTSQALALGIRAAVDIVSVATSAARDARNGALFLSQVESACGLRLEIIDGEREAQLSYLAARREFGTTHGPLLVEDIGGGSTELIFGSGEQLHFARSLPIGSVRLFERWIHTDPPTGTERAEVEGDIRRALGDIEGKPGIDFVGLAGTWTTLAAIACGSHTYDVSQVHGRVLLLAEVTAITDLLWRTPLEERRTLPGLQPGRADVIPIGASIACLSMEMLALRRVTISDRGVRWGLLYERVAVQS